MAFVSGRFLFSRMYSIACKIFGLKRKSSSDVIDSFLFLSFDEILRFLKAASISLYHGVFYRCIDYVITSEKDSKSYSDFSLILKAISTN